MFLSCVSILLFFYFIFLFYYFILQIFSESQERNEALMTKTVATSVI